MNILIPKTETIFKRDLNKRNALKITKNFVDKYSKQMQRRALKTSYDFDEGESSEGEQEEPKDDEGAGFSPSRLRSEVM